MVTCIKGSQPEVLTSVTVEFFKHLVVAHIKANLPLSPNLIQFCCEPISEKAKELIMTCMQVMQGRKENLLEDSVY